MIFESFEISQNTDKMRVLVKDWPPYLKGTVKENGDMEYTGLGMDVLHDLSKYYGINYTLVNGENLPWGTLQNGS